MHRDGTDRSQNTLTSSIIHERSFSRAYNKTYSRINWKNEQESLDTPLNAINLNRMDSAVDTIDDRVIQLDISKASQEDNLKNVKGVDYNPTTGVFTFTFQNGSTYQADLNIEKIPVDFSMSPDGIITMTTADGSTYTADIASLIKEYEFIDSGTIEWQVRTDEDGNKHVKADILEGSIDGSKLQPNYLADVTVQAGRAETAAGSAEASAQTAQHWAEEAEKHGDITWANTTGKPFETLNPEHFEVEGGELSVIGGGGGGGTEVPAHPAAWYEEHWDEIPEGGHYIITDDFEDPDWRGHIEEEISDVRQDLTQLLEWKLLIRNTSAPYTIPSNIDYKELRVTCGREADSSAPRPAMVFIKGENERVRLGYYTNSTNYGFADVTKNGEIITPSYYNNGASVTPYMSVWYR